MPTWLTVREGLLPGDVSLSFEREGLRVALVGLNSAFLHLGDDAEEKLALEIEQLQGVCGDNPPRWLREHHVALLLTHHPRAWLHPRAREIFDASIVGRDRFTAHLYGHMHEVAMARHAVGGSPERRTVQGPSLFGLETFDDGRQQRIHGYVAGRITVQDGRGTLQLWPRLRERMNAGYHNLVPAYALDLTDEAVTFPFTPRAVRNAVAAPAVSPTAVPAPSDAGVLAAPVAAVTEPAAVAVSDRELRAALCRYFDAVPRIRMLLRDAGVETTRVDFAQGAALVWDAALPELRRARRLGALLALACEEYPEADDLRALASRVTD